MSTNDKPEPCRKMLADLRALRAEYARTKRANGATYRAIGRDLEVSAATAYRMAWDVAFLPPPASQRLVLVSADGVQRPSAESQAYQPPTPDRHKTGGARRRQHRSDTSDMLALLKLIQGMAREVRKKCGRDRSGIPTARAGVDPPRVADFPVSALVHRRPGEADQDQPSI